MPPSTARSRRHGIDYLRGGEGGSKALPSFELSLKELGRQGLSFDLQCAPEQLSAAHALIEGCPETRVVVDHLGKPRMMREGEDDGNLDLWCVTCGRSIPAEPSKLFSLLSLYV